MLNETDFDILFVYIDYISLDFVTDNRKNAKKQESVIVNKKTPKFSEKAGFFGTIIG